MAEKKQYIAVQGIDFDELPGKPRVEPGDPIPAIPKKTVDELLAIGAIREAE